MVGIIVQFHQHFQLINFLRRCYGWRKCAFDGFCLANSQWVSHSLAVKEAERGGNYVARKRGARDKHSTGGHTLSSRCSDESAIQG